MCTCNINIGLEQQEDPWGLLPTNYSSGFSELSDSVWNRDWKKSDGEWPRIKHKVEICPWHSGSHMCTCINTPTNMYIQGQVHTTMQIHMCTHVQKLEGEERSAFHWNMVCLSKKSVTQHIKALLEFDRVDQTALSKIQLQRQKKDITILNLPNLVLESSRLSQYSSIIVTLRIMMIIR